MTDPYQRDLSRAEWFKSSHSQGTADTCVEVALNLPDVVPVRDSKDPNGPALVFDPAVWRAFTASLKG